MPSILDIKVSSPEESKELQKFLFSKGYTWDTQGNQSTMNEYANIICLWDDNTLAWSNTEISKDPTTTAKEYLMKHNSPLWKVLND